MPLHEITYSDSRAAYALRQQRLIAACKTCEERYNYFEHETDNHAESGLWEQKGIDAFEELCNWFKALGIEDDYQAACDALGIDS